MAQTLKTQEVNRLLDGMEAQGCTVKECKGGYRILPPDGSKPLTLHLTLSDGRGMKNLRAQALKQGLYWPLDARK